MPDTEDLLPSVSDTPEASSADTGEGTQPSQPVQQQSQPIAGATSSPAPAAPATVGNPTPVDQNHPAVQKASLLRTIAQTLAGGPRYNESIDVNTGRTTRTEAPLTSKQIGMAIAMEAITGSLAGLSQIGPGATGRAAAAGFQATSQQRQQVDAAAHQQATDDVNQQSAALARQASATELGMRQILNTAQAERMGVDSLKDAVAQNKDLVASYNDAGEVQAAHVSQDSLLAGMNDGTYSPATHIAVPDGFISTGNGKFEQTFSLVRNPDAKVPLTSDQAKEFADNGVPGFAAFKTSGIPTNFTVPGTIISRANAQLTANKLMLTDVADVSKALSESDDPANKSLAQSIPSFKALLADPQTGASLADALSRFQKYVSHSDMHGMDLYQSLKQMATPSKADPSNPKQFLPNRDAPFANTIAGAFGGGDAQKGWALLSAYSDEIAPEEIKNEGEAADMIASSEPGSRSYKYAQRWIASNTSQKAAVAGAVERARDGASPSSSSSGGSHASPDALGFVPTVTDPKIAEKHFGTFKKNLDDLSKTEQSYAQFQTALSDISKGNWSGAESVVSLFAAIGLSAAPLAGKGFRVSQNVIDEHRTARGWQGALQAKLASAQTGAVITPQQLKDYSNIAAQARTNQYISTANEMHGAGISADAALPMGNGQKIDPTTAGIFLHLTGGDRAKARAAASAKGWSF